MTRIRITTHSGEDDIIDVPDYDAVDVTTKRNDNDVQAIKLGENSYSRIDIKNITVEEVIEEETTS